MMKRDELFETLFLICKQIENDSDIKTPGETCYFTLYKFGSKLFDCDGYSDPGEYVIQEMFLKYGLDVSFLYETGNSLEEDSFYSSFAKVKNLGSKQKQILSRHAAKHYGETLQW